MTRSKLGLLGLCVAVLGTMAMFANSAQAALSWLILDATLTTATYLLAKVASERDNVDISLKTKLLGLVLTFTCTNSEPIGANLEPIGTVTEGFKIKFTGCEAYGAGTLGEPLGCQVRSAGQAVGTVVTEELKGGLELHAQSTILLFKIEPKVAGGPLVTIKTEGCAIPESNPVNGVVYLKDCEGFATTHRIKHLVEQGPLTSLYLGKHTVEHLETSILGSSWVLLGGEHNGRLFSGMDM
jgi:hypothetical protein